MKMKKLIEKRLKVARMRQLLNQLHNDEISFSRMVEIINDESGSLILKELDEKELERLQKIGNKYIIEGVGKKMFISQYGILRFRIISLNSNKNEKANMDLLLLRECYYL